MRTTYRRLGFALAVFAWGQAFCGAQSVPAAPRGPQSQDPHELEAALLAADPAQAERLFWRFSCGFYGNDESLEVVRRAWELRDSSGATGATRDPVVRALMAKCIAESWPRFRPLEQADAPVVAQLRTSIASDTPEEARAAAFGLAQIATAEDVKAMEGAAERLPSLRSMITGALGEVCRLDAIAAAKTIKASVSDARQLAEIENIEAHTAKTRRLLCAFDANIVGSAVSQADIDDFLAPNFSGPDRDVGDVAAILSSTNIPEAKDLLWKLRCWPDRKENFDLVNKAWQHRNSGASNLATRDFGVRALMAKCLVNSTSTASLSRVPDSVVEQLRQAVKSEDKGDFLVGVQALTRVATAADIRLIVDAVQGRSPVLVDITVHNLTRSCAPGAQRAVMQIREHITKPQTLGAIDYQIWSTERVREYVCGKGGTLRGQRISDPPGK